MADVEIQNNEDEFHDAREEQPNNLLPLPALQLPRPKITKKQSNGKQLALAQHHAEPKQFTTKDVEYLEYKKKLLGKLEVDRNDSYCDFYLCNDMEQIAYFAKNIKGYALNTKLSDNHISSMAKKISKTREVYFVNPIAVIEYIRINADSPRDLIEIIDGHHRLKCLINLFSTFDYDDNEEYSFTFWVQVYKCDNQKSALELFRKYNTCKPFAINLDLTDLITLIIDKLNTQFNRNKFEFIKNTIQRANRPSFCKTEFAEKLEARLEDQLRTTDKEDYHDISIDNIITKFINYNESLLNEPLQWFNHKHKGESSKITEKMFKKAKDNKCYLGLLHLEDLIQACVCL